MGDLYFRCTCSFTSGIRALWAKQHSKMNATVSHSQSMAIRCHAVVINPLSFDSQEGSVC